MQKYKATNVTTQSEFTTASGIGTGQGLGLARTKSRPASFIMTPLKPSRAPCLLAIPVQAPLPVALPTVADLVTSFLTAAVRLAYQLHWDWLRVQHPCYFKFLPEGLPIISLITASLYCHQCLPRPSNSQLPVVWLTAQSVACSA